MPYVPTILVPVAMSRRTLLTVLAIDDNVANLELIIEAITHNGIQILTAQDAESGFRLFNSSRP